ncbi:hypothetical protein KEM54_002959 [Ascosphaera aggregata]|nr:hypothetical protein KEM54_002959 [Ascosphaera aggregata]
MDFKYPFFLICLLHLFALLAGARSLLRPDEGSADRTVAPTKRMDDYSQRVNDQREAQREAFRFAQIRTAILGNRKRDDITKEQAKLSFRKGGGFGDMFGGRGGGKSGSRGGGKGGQPKPHPNERPPQYSAVPRSYGGGRYYGGGATAPYVAGRLSPLGLAPFMLLPLAALAFFPGPWLHGGYLYHGAPYHVHNDTDGNDDGRDVPVTCICQQESHCGCEKNDNETYIDSIVKEKRPDGLPKNSSIIRVVTVNGTEGIYINGTIPSKEGDEKSYGVMGHHFHFTQGCGYLVIAGLVCAFTLAV